MTIEEKMEHFRSISLESANSQSIESLSSYKKSLDDELDIYKDSAKHLAEESKRSQFNQVKADSKKELSSAQMSVKKELTKTQLEIKSKVFDFVREKINVYRTTPEYTSYLIKQINEILQNYKDFEMTIYIDPDDSGLLAQLKKETNGNIMVSDKNFLGGTRTIVPEKNILVDYSFKTRLSEERENFTITL